MDWSSIPQILSGIFGGNVSVGDTPQGPPTITGQMPLALPAQKSGFDEFMGLLGNQNIAGALGGQPQRPQAPVAPAFSFHGAQPLQVQMPATNPASIRNRMQ